MTMDTTDSKAQPRKSSVQNNPSTNRKQPGKGFGGVFLLAFAVILILGSWAFLVVNQQNKNKEYNALEAQYLDISGQLITRDSLINDWIDLFDQVEKNLQFIKGKENLLAAMQSEDMELTRDKREIILRDIQLLNTLLEDNKKKIAQLNEKLKTSGMKITGLEKKIEELTLNLDQRNQHIDSLKSYLAEQDFRVSELNTRITDMEVSLVQKNTTIATQKAELNKAYIVSGTYKELKAKGLIAKEGGFLWVGRTTSLRNDVAPDGFTEVDITQTKTILVNSKKVELITEHPNTSYELVRDGNELIACINITNPDEFWRLSKYAVVETLK
jgi:uncharacterized protein HemX